MNNLKALRYFVAVVDAGSLTAASEAISIAQPALTRQIRELEEDFGTQLLHRLPRGVRMTPAGVTLYESAQRILSEADRVSQNLRNGTGDTASVSLGVPLHSDAFCCLDFLKVVCNSRGHCLCGHAKPSRRPCWSGWNVGLSIWRS